jgi:hypothetical protein
MAAPRQMTRCRQATTLDGPAEKSSETRKQILGTAGRTASSRVIAPNTKRGYHRLERTHNAQNQISGEEFEIIKVF